MLRFFQAAAVGVCLGNGLAAEVGAKPKQSPATIGIPDQTNTGKLPVLTTGLSERAARAFGQGKWEEARKAYKEMLVGEPDNALALANLGAVEQQLGHLKEAQDLMMKALAINPTLQQTRIALGMLGLENGDTYLALSSLSRAVHEDPTDAKAHNYLAVVAKKLGWLDAAEAELRRAIELNPEYANAHFNLALMYTERKPPSLELAKRHYEKAVALGAEKDEIIEQKLKEK